MSCTSLPMIDPGRTGVIEHRSHGSFSEDSHRGGTSHHQGDTSHRQGDTSHHQGDTSHHQGDTSYHQGDTSLSYDDDGIQDKLEAPDQFLMTEQRIQFLKEKLDGEDDLIKDLMESVSQLKDLSEIIPSDDHTTVLPALDVLPDKELMNYLHKLHASNVPDHRKNLLQDISNSFNVSCQQLGLILEQLRYLAEKELAVRLLCPRIVDPENLDHLVKSMEEDPFQDKILISSIVSTIAAML